MGLLPHNQETFCKIKKVLEDTKSLLIVQGTGVGKSFLTMEIVKKLYPGKKVLYISPKKDIEQNMRKYKDFQELSSQFTFCTNNSFSNDDRAQEYLFDYDIFIVDEAHHIASPLFGGRIQTLITLVQTCNENKRVIGLTATPQREDKINVSQYFEQTVNGYSIFDCIEKGLMPPIEYMLCQKEPLDADIAKQYNIKTSFNQSYALLKEIVQDNPKKQWMAFFANRRDLEDNIPVLERAFPEHRLVIIHNKVSQVNKILQTIQPEEKVIIASIDKLIEGIHLDNMDGLVLFRNVQSLTVFQQMIGRVMSIGKKESPLIIDCTETAPKMFAKLMHIGHTRGPVVQDDLVINQQKPLLVVSLQNKKYYDISKVLANLNGGLLDPPVEFKGKLYDNSFDLCREYHLNYSVVYSTMRKRNMSFVDTVAYYVEKNEHPEQDGFVYQGVLYTSKIACCDAFGLNPNTINNYANKENCTYQEAIDYFNAQGKRDFSFEYQGERYNSLKDATQSLGLSYRTVQAYKASHKCTNQEALDSVRAVFSYNGKTYKNVRACLKDLGISKGSYDGQRSKGLSVEESIRVCENRKNKISDTSICINGQIYSSYIECCKELGLSKDAVYLRVKRKGMTYEESILYGIQHNGYMILGKRYRHIKDALEEYHIPKRVYDTCKKKAGTVEGAIRMALDQLDFEYDLE